jgi:hypothetical protein
MEMGFQRLVFVVFLILKMGLNEAHAQFELDEDELDSIQQKRTFREWAQTGEFQFHWRTFYTGTVNQGDLTNYSALATGAGLGYKSPEYKGFSVAFSGFFVFQLHEHNINMADPITNGTNRYEITLFDMNDLDNKRDLDRLEDLYLRYSKKKFKLTFGRQKLNTPLLNEQDNRMRPNVFSALNLDYSWRNFEFQAATIHAMTIRGTVDWYSVQNSFGVYPFGRTAFGTSSDYKNNTKSHGIAVLGVKYHQKNVKAEMWNYFAENVFNLVFMQTEWQKPSKNGTLQLGLQGFWQRALDDGGNPDPHKAYILPETQVFAAGGKVQWSKNRHQISLNSMHISKGGRFQFPREWGREVFYASLPRERFEGNGGVSAFTFKYVYKLPKKQLKLDFGAGAVRLPDINATELNKYGMPSYYHFVFAADYSLSGYFEGLHLRILAVNKIAQKPSQIPDAFRINRVDMWHFNVVVDYWF